MSDRIPLKKGNNHKAVVATLVEYWKKSLPTSRISKDDTRSISRFVMMGITPEKVMEAMDIALTKCRRGNKFKYFCGVCWNWRNG